MRPVIAIVIAVLFTGCGPFMAGTWKDDPKNWKRYFKESLPPEIVLYHSCYWRSPQPIFLEYSCYFEIEDTPAARSHFGFGEVIKRTSNKISDRNDSYTIGGETVPWFPSSTSIGTFEVWRPEDSSRYVVIVDIDHRRIFIADNM